MGMELWSDEEFLKIYGEEDLLIPLSENGDAVDRAVASRLGVTVEQVEDRASRLIGDW